MPALQDYVSFGHSFCRFCGGSISMRCVIVTYARPFSPCLHNIAVNINRRKRARIWPRLPPPTVRRCCPPVYQVFMMIQTRFDTPYSTILAETDRTTRRIWGTAFTIALAVVFRRSLARALRTLAMAAFSLVSTRLLAA